MRFRFKADKLGSRSGPGSGSAGRHLFTLVLALTVSGIAVGHDPGPEHGCVVPARPPDDQDELRWNSYLAGVDGYRSCINDFAQANRLASRLHTEAANAAVSDWNAFVKDQLNVPEDFPWPPE